MVFWYDHEAKTYTVQLSRDTQFTRPITVGGLELPMYNHSAELALGEWFWRYRTTHADEAVSNWSPTRRFVVTDRAIPFAVPTLDTIMAKLPTHPRIYVTPEPLDAFRKRRLGPAKSAFFDLERAAAGQADKLPKTPETGDALPPDPKRRGQAFWLTPDGPHVTPKVAPSTLENAAAATAAIKEATINFFILQNSCMLTESGCRTIFFPPASSVETDSNSTSTCTTALPSTEGISAP